MDMPGGTRPINSNKFMKARGILIATGIFPPDIGGPASYAKTLATKVAKSSPVTVISYSPVRNSELDKELPFRVIRVWRGWPKGLRHLIYLCRVLGQARNYEVVFVLNAVSAGVPARLAARFSKREFVVTIVGDVAWEYAANKKQTSLLLDDYQKFERKGWSGLLHKLQFLVCKGAHSIIVPSKYLSNIVAGWGIPKDKIDVVYNGVDFTPSSLDKSAAKEKLALQGNIILTVGRLVPWKGFRMLIKIMPQIIEINPFFKLVIVGEGPDRGFLEAIIRNLKLERRVILTGKKKASEVAEYLAAADIFILNSGYEGFSHQILEAMTAGVPVVASAMGGNREVIEQGENGFIVKYNDEFNLVEAVKTLWNSSELREKFIQEGKNTVKKFSHEKMFKETLAILGRQSANE